MPERSYLCRVIGTGRSPGTLSEFDPGDPFRAAILDDLLPPESHWMLDLRTFEDRLGRAGWCVATVEALDVRHVLFAVRYGAVPTTKPEIDAVIGSEATDEPFTDSRDYLFRVHRRRRRRDVQERSR
jgi:hypothetical protein